MEKLSLAPAQKFHTAIPPALPPLPPMSEPVHREGEKNNKALQQYGAITFSAAINGCREHNEITLSLSGFGQ